MILPDYKIREWVKSGGVHPVGPGCINPASIDLRISSEFRNLVMPEILQNKSVIDLWPSQAILATTMEYIKMPRDLAGVMYLKSSWARQGLDHALAGWVDPGFEGQLTMELHTHRPLQIRAHSRLCQLVLYRLESAVENPYSGRYQGQRGPTEAK
jgi:dCTP deaminase